MSNHDILWFFQKVINHYYQKENEPDIVLLLNKFQNLRDLEYRFGTVTVEKQQQRPDIR